MQIPTTLLSMVDASVGGKTGVDLPEGKNLVGAFKQPEMVVVDPEVLSTLPEVEFRSGLAEVVKHGIIDSLELFTALEDGKFELTWMLYEAINVKVRVVQEDPFERGRRAVLNLGHTFGHAFEWLSNYQIRHGEAVAMGIVCASRFATTLGDCPPETTDRILALLKHLNLADTPPSYPATDVWNAMLKDKKRQGDTVPLILPRAIGDVDVFKDIPKTQLIDFLETL
ncbi:MAG: 3-dehydroquinate synthase family protein [Chloroflexota bacterium]